MQVVRYIPQSRYTSRTPVIGPVLVKFIRAGTIAMLEWSSLRFVDHAPIAVWIITSIIALLVLAVLESKDWLRFKGGWYFSVSVATLLVIWIVGVGTTYAVYGFTSDTSTTSSAGAAVLQTQLNDANKKLYLASLTPEQRQVLALSDENKRLSEGDHQRLSDALYEFAGILDRAQQLWGPANILGSDLTRAINSGDVAKNSVTYIARLANLQKEGNSFYQDFLKLSQKWQYYSAQRDYIFGKEPDNIIRLVENAANEQSDFIQKWMKIQNATETPILQLLYIPQNKFGEMIRSFALWGQASRLRLQQMRDTLK
jgi:hypothetical protein